MLALILIIAPVVILEELISTRAAAVVKVLLITVKEVALSASVIETEPSERVTSPAKVANLSLSNVNTLDGVLSPSVV